MSLYNLDPNLTQCCDHRLASGKAANETIQRLHGHSITGWQDGNIRLQVTPFKPTERQSVPTPPNTYVG